jgi:hypothetical protein
LTILVSLSLILDLRTLNQIKMGYIKKNLTIVSLLLDILIFGGGLWEIVEISKSELDKTANIGMSILIVLTFLRVINLVIAFMYIFFFLIISCMPECCNCKKFIEN